MRVNAIFKCRLCGGIEKREWSLKQVQNAMKQIEFPGSRPEPPEHRQPIAIKHRCQDAFEDHQIPIKRERSYGIADFIGYEEIPEPEGIPFNGEYKCTGCDEPFIVSQPVPEGKPVLCSACQVEAQTQGENP